VLRDKESYCAFFRRAFKIVLGTFSKACKNGLRSRYIKSMLVSVPFWRLGTGVQSRGETKTAVGYNSLYRQALGNRSAALRSVRTVASARSCAVAQCL
jgi:peptidyl-tRNA hydrolase